MTDESSLDGSEWHHGDETGSWDSEDDLAEIMSQLCRICGEACDDLIECFGEKGKEIMLVDKIHTHLPIMVTEEDLLPVNVCTSCISKIEMCHELVTNCLEADAKMRALLGFDAPEGYEEPYNYVRSGTPDSYVSSEKTERSQDDDYTGPDMKEYKDSGNEEKNDKALQKKDSNEEEDENKKKKNNFQQEIRSTYKVILLKMKKSTNMSLEDQLRKALTYLHAAGKAAKPTAASSPKSALKNTPENKDNSNNKTSSSEVGAASEKKGEQGTQDKDAETEENVASKEKDSNILDWEDVNYECIYCDENVMGKSNFVTHQKTVHSNEVFSCHKCELVYELKEDFDEHVKSHDSEKTTSSDAEDSTPSKPTDHENGKRKFESPDERVVKKLKIDSIFPLAESVLNQIQAESDDIFWKCKIWQCKLCGEVSVSKQGWREHDCEPQELQCSICSDDVQYTSEKELAEHYQSVHEAEERLEDEEQTNRIQPRSALETKYQCSTCGKIFNSFLQLSQHCKTHMGQFKCPHCERTFNRQSNLANHIRRHKTETGFTCRICLETFSNRGDLLSHRRTHTREELLGLKTFAIKTEVEEGEDESSQCGAFKCPVCYRAFHTKQKLDSHIVMHTDSSFPCHICGKVLSKKNTLEYHLRTHTGEKPYTCSMCPGAFQSRVGLIVHERIHTGEKPYQCDQCEMAFRCRATLNQHKVVHSEERPYQCIHCGRGFRRRDTLDTHIRTHTDERPYACRICGRAFRQKGDCSKHEKTHNKQSKSVVLFAEGDGAGVYSCPLCGQMYELKEELDNHFENEHTPEEKASSIVIINSENVITIPGIATVDEDAQELVLHELT